MINNLTSIVEWGELAGIATVSVLLFNIFLYFKSVISQKIRVNKILSDRRTISLLVDTNADDGVILSYRTYFKRKLVFYIAFGKWEDYKQIPIVGNSGAYIIDKNDILRNSKSASDSYNFILEIPNTDIAKQLYFAKLAYQGYIITGRGTVSESDSNRWLIYFVHDL